MANLLAYGTSIIGGGGGSGSGGHEIQDATGTALAQEDALQFAGYLNTTDDSSNGRTVVKDVETVTWTVWQTMTTQQKQGKHWIIIDAPETMSEDQAIYRILNQQLTFTNLVATITDANIGANDAVLVYYNNDSVAKDAVIEVTWTEGVVTFTAENVPASTLSVNVFCLKPSFTSEGGGGGTITVDDVLSTTSENPVQNKVITGALNNKADSSSLATVATSGAYSDLSGTPSSLPASDVSDWAKASTKPNYTWSEISNKPSLITASVIASDYNSSTVYTMGKFCFKDSTLYQCIAETATGAWDSTKWVATSVGANLPPFVLGAENMAYGYYDFLGTFHPFVTADATSPTIIKNQLVNYGWTTWWEQSGSYYSRDDRDTQLAGCIAAGMIYRFIVTQNGTTSFFMVNAIRAELNTSTGVLKVYLNGVNQYQVWMQYAGNVNNRDAHLTYGVAISDGYVTYSNVSNFISIDMHENVTITS